ncbi:MAG TPA: hypothetical protein PKA58_06260 [Polyangium sp.]|nr:hypothetical protein [Polyangium sp.]
MQKVVLWIGPVWPGIIRSAVPAEWSILTFDDHKAGGNGSEAYKNWALSLGPDPLSQLAPNAHQIVIAGFSRAHGAIDVLLGRAAANQDNRITSLVALDAYYSAVGNNQPKPGYLNWCSLALARNLPVVFTSSSGHRPIEQSASTSLIPLATALQLRAAKVTIPGLPEPAKSFGRGSILWLDYEAKFRHEQHPLVLGPALFSTGVPLRNPVNGAFIPSQAVAPPPSQSAPRKTPAQAIAPQQTTPQQRLTAPSPSPPSGGPGAGFALGVLLLAGLGAMAFSLRRVVPTPKALAEKGESHTKKDEIPGQTARI